MRRATSIASAFSLIAVLAARGAPPSALAQSTSTQTCVQHGGQWETGLIRSTELKGPIVLTTLHSSADPSKSKTQFLILHDPNSKPDAIDSEWISIGAFGGALFVKAGAALKPRPQDVNYAGVLYSGCRLK